MNKKIIILILGTLLVGFVVAGAVLIRDKTVDVLVVEHSYEDVATDEWFQRVLITETNFKLPTSERFPTYTMECDSFNVTLIQNDALVYETHNGLTAENLPKKTVGVSCLSEVRVDLTDEEMETILDEWHNEILIEIDEIKNERENEASKTIVRRGNVAKR